jgi:hypothetical protein
MKSSFSSIANRGFLILYFVIAIVPIIFILISLFSYFSVLNAFGEVPYNDTLYEMARERGITIKVFPTEYGGYLFALAFLAYLLLPVIILINYLSFKVFKGIKFNYQWAIGCVVICIVSFVFNITDTCGWYISFIVD